MTVRYCLLTHTLLSMPSDILRMGSMLGLLLSRCCWMSHTCTCKQQQVNPQSAFSSLLHIRSPNLMQHTATRCCRQGEAASTQHP